ncbi:ribosome maturation factor RimM [Stackebrandtia nassauensis]|uniref:Ribosome maturation factor RimM n=1 Tax=Stackebrandtia nassauensis (strain DSM 44728 / CIP 108903 / NRRL B-16338 / NBRC 102104 / LLR-40K-21) TaxID=446470 RepID=D3Q208_STANL|nr:ribosome maturation factor RimM [Stackebrandtia nassauensis]ADD41875.1 16S rRNA processing protein RimM [Stackebrandtia nassauensis DSM 44728]
MKLVVGRIVRSHGVRGDLIVEVRTDEPEQRFAGGSVLHTDPPRFGPVTVERVRWYQERLLLTLEGVADRDAAEAMRGVALTVDSEDVEVPEDPDEFRDLDLVGLSVVEESGAEIGTVVRVEHAPAHDLLVVDRPGANQALIPFIQAMVPTVDVAGGRIVVTLPEGLLDL